MNFNYNPNLEPMNFVDGIEFTKNDECIWNVYPPGAGGDLLASIINAHYGRTGSDYFGINDNGQVIFRPSDYKLTNSRHLDNQTLFDDQHFYDISDSLGSRNLNYSLLDQFIFSNHLYTAQEIRHILATFPKARVINTFIATSQGTNLVKFMSKLKNLNQDIGFNSALSFTKPTLVSDPRVINLPFGVLFNESSYYYYYDRILNFLGLSGRLICFDYIKYYLSKQHPEIQDKLVEYSKTL